MGRDGVTVKARLNLKLDEDLKDWVQEFADQNGTSVSALVRDYFLALRQRVELEKNAECVDQI